MTKYLKIDQVVESVSITHKFNKPKLKFLNTSDVENGKIININYLSVNELKGQAKKTIRKNDILFSEIRPKNRRFAYIDIDDTDDFVVSTKLMVLRNINREVDNKYFYYYLTNDHMLSILQDRAENRIGSFPQITFDLLSEYSIRVPKLNEQKEIASVLSTFDSKLELNNRINIELDAVAKTIYDYWFVQFDFSDAKGKPYKSSGGKMVWNEKLKKEIPEGWTDGQLSDIANITMGQSPPGESYNETQDGVIFFQGCTDFGNRFPTVRQFTNSPTRLAKAGDILLSVRAPVGTLNIANQDCCIGRGLAALNSKQNANAYLFGVLQNFKQVFDRRNVDGTTFGSITKDDLFSLKVAMPPNDLIEKYQKIVSAAFEKQNCIEKENIELVSLRDWLLPMLMNGQVKVADTQDEQLSIAAEEHVEYNTGLNIPNNKKTFAKQVLGGKIVSLYKDDPHFTQIKFQKLQFLAEHVIQADLNLNYYFQAAGPYDNRFMHTINDSLKKSKWFDYKNNKYVPLDKQSQISEYYNGYFKPVTNKLERLFSLLQNATEADAEIIATIYAVWNNRLIQSLAISDDLLIEDFYKWSKRKQQYTQEQILTGLNWLRKNNFEPTGFGKLIKQAKK